MLKAIKLLRKTNFLSIKPIFYLVRALLDRGVNLVAILRFAAWLYPDKTALVNGKEKFSYQELYQHVHQSAIHLKDNYQLKAKQKIAIIAANHTELVLSLFAAAYLGMDVYLLNADLGGVQFKEIVARHQFDFIIYDPPFSSLIKETGYLKRSSPTYDDKETLVMGHQKTAGLTSKDKIQRSSFNKIVILTSGTMGTAKSVSRKAAISDYAGLFLSLLDKLNFTAHKVVYIATPIGHGFGLAALCFSCLMGKEIHIRPGFNHIEACEMIRKYKIQAVTLVPLMLRRMLDHDVNALRSLECIISGGAILPPVLAKETRQRLGDKLYNLYGTSEAGVCLLATPEELDNYPGTIGKPLDGVALKLIDKAGKDTKENTPGQLMAKCAWSAGGKGWISTGDIGYKDEHGYFYLLGRADDMVVSGGENVYPYELEQLLIQHPGVREAVVTGIKDEEFGHRLAAGIVLHHKNSVSQQDLIQWLSGKAARYQMPKKIIFLHEIPLTAMGKPDKKNLTF